MTEQSKEVTSQARQSRRRLLKAGAVGAPLILTFRSTSAWAISAGCLIQEGDKNIPGNIVKVDENFQPLPGPGNSTQKIYVSKNVGDVADGNLDRDSLRALVYNNNIGQTCLASITNGTPV